LVLKRLSELEADRWREQCDVYAFPVERIRLDATSRFGYHAVEEGGLIPIW
jgi:hypothetical protein